MKCHKPYVLQGVDFNNGVHIMQFVASILMLFYNRDFDPFDKVPEQVKETELMELGAPDSCGYFAGTVFKGTKQRTLYLTINRWASLFLSKYH